MHPDARDFVARYATTDPVTVIEIGGRDVNGGVRDLFPNATWWTIDAQDGPAVDEVANGATWKPAAPVDVVVCCEVFEHTPHWRAIVANIPRMLVPCGRAILTMAGPGRAPHGLHADDPDQPGWYANIAPDELVDALNDAAFSSFVVEDDADVSDLRAVAVAL